jgi:hypothetical protein
VIKIRSYVKLYGPPVFEAIQELQKIAVDMPEVCIMDQLFKNQSPSLQAAAVGTSQDMTMLYFERIGKPITVERCNKIISDSGEMLGEYDFFFEWFEKPDFDKLRELIKKIDKRLEPLNVRYSIVTKKR